MSRTEAHAAWAQEAQRGIRNRGREWAVSRG